MMTRRFGQVRCVISIFLLLRYSVKVSTEVPPTRCGGDMVAPAGGPVTSPNYPSNYDDNAFCEWLITVPTGRTIRLTFASFNTEEDYDHLVIYDGANYRAPQLQRLTGSQPPSPITSTSHVMFLRFTSDYSTTSQGFQFSYTSKGADQCWDPGVPDSGTRDPNGNFTTGQTVVYTCNTGYPMQGATTITCLSNGTWSDATPTCGGERLKNFMVRIGMYANLLYNHQCGETYTATPTNGQTIVVNCDPPMSGRYVSIQLMERTDNLQLCEVEVYGTEAELCGLAAFHQVAQSDCGGAAVDIASHHGVDLQFCVDACCADATCLSFQHNAESSCVLKNKLCSAEEKVLAASGNMYDRLDVPVYLRYTEEGGKYVKVFPHPMTYDAARQTCAADGAHLVDVKTRELRDFLVAEVRKVDGSKDYWIGLNDLADEGTWMWSDGTPINTYNFTDWAPGEPNSNGGYEDCGHLWSDFKWNDDSCARQKYFICQIGVNCPLGYTLCGHGLTCIQPWKHCDGNSDCSDGSDEEDCACFRIPDQLHPSGRLAMLPNMLGQTGVDEIQNSSVVDLLNSSDTSPEKQHPEFMEFVSTVIFPRCIVLEENNPNCQLSPSSNVTNKTCELTLLVPCRSWCEEVLNEADDRIKALLPPCDVLPPPGHSCWNPEPTKKGDEVCYHGNGMNYRETWSKTTSGAKCEEWSVAEAGYYKTEYTWANLDINYCRNPTGLERPFCLTEDGSQEECDIIPCNVNVCLDRGPPNYGKRSPTKRFYYVGERVTYTCNEGYTIGYGSPMEVRCVEENKRGIWEYNKPICSVNYKRRLQVDLLQGYSADLAPENVGINFTGYLEQIVDLIWQDSRLKWAPTYYGGIETFSLPGSRLWTPAFTLKRNANADYKGLEKNVPVRVSSDGLVEWRVEILTTTVCDADPFFFPADTMECNVCFSVASAVEQTIQCQGRSSCDFFTATITEGEWYRRDKIFTKDNKEACFALYLARIPLFHIATTVGPCSILVILMTIMFIMPIDKGDRISFGVTIQLSMVVSLVFVTEVLPVKGALPFFATLIIVCMGVMGIFLFFTLVIMILHEKKGRLPPSAKIIFLRYMAKMLLLGDLTKRESACNGEAGLTKLIHAERTNFSFYADDGAELTNHFAAKMTNGALHSNDRSADDDDDDVINQNAVELTNSGINADDMKAAEGESTAEMSHHASDSDLKSIRRASEPPTGLVSSNSSTPNVDRLTKAVTKGNKEVTGAVESGVQEIINAIKKGDDDQAKAVKKGNEELVKAVKNETAEMAAVKNEMARMTMAVKIGTEVVKTEMEALTKAMDNEEEVTDYTLLAKVLDRLCLVLYIISIITAIPLTMYLGKH